MRFPSASVHHFGRCALAIGAAVLLATCSQFNKTDYYAVGGKSFASRGKAAEVTNVPDLDLLRQGYIQIGSLTVQREGKEDTTAICRSEAGQRGADLIRLSENNATRTEKTTNRSCAETISTSRSEYYCPPIGGASCYNRQISQTQCVRWTTTAGPDVRVVRSNAALFRKEPALAAEQIRAWALPNAIADKDAGKVEQLLKSGTDPNRTMVSGALPLNAAVLTGNAATVSAVLAAGAKVDAVVPGGANTPLMIAVQQGKPDIVKALLDRGAKADAVTPDGNDTVIGMAVRDGKPAIMGLLLDRGVDVNGRYGRTERTPLIEAAKAGNTETVEYLVKRGADVNRGSGRNFLPLHEAAFYGHVAVIEQLVKKGANVNAAVTNGWTPLMTAARNRNPEGTRLLIRLGANVNAVNADPRGSSTCCTALAIAASNRNTAVAEELRKAGAIDTFAPPTATVAPPAAGGSAKVHPVFGAATAGRLAEVKSHLDAGMDPNILRDSSRLTPLMVAAEHGKTDVMRLLLERGANVDHDTPTGNALVYAALNGHEAAATLLLERGADPNSKSVLGSTPIIFAAAKGQTNLVKLLIDKGADVNAVGSLKETALGNAATGGRVEIVQILLDKGANPNAANYEGKTVLFRVQELKALSGGKKDEIVALLKARGAK